MTDCKDCTNLMQGYLDNELDTAAASGVRAHLAACPDCRALYNEEKALIDAVRAQAPYHQAPALLPGAIMKSTTAAAPAPQKRKSSWLHIWAPAAPFAAIACALLLYVAVPASNGQTEEIVSEHVRSLMEHHLIDVVSSDRHTVKPWFTGKLDFSPPVYDFTAQGYPLLGGRLDYLQHRNVAALAYRRNKHIINVFVAPEPGPDKPDSVKTLRGFNVVSWRKNGLGFSAVSDLNAQELKVLADLFVKQN